MANSEPVNIEFLLRENISKGMKEMSRAVGDAEAAQKKASQSLKDEINKQRQLIREITQDIRNLNNAHKDAKAGSGKDEILGNLLAAKKSLAEEQATLIGLQREQIEVNGQEEKSQGGLIASIGKWAGGLFAIHQAMQLFKNIMESTDKTAVAFEGAITGARTSLEYFYRTVATGDYSNFLQNLKNAFQRGKNYVEQMDDIEERSREYQLKNLETNRKIEEARRVFYASDKTGLEEKVKAGEEMLKYMKEKSDREVEIAVDTYNSLAEIEKSKNKLSAEDTRYGIENYTLIKKYGSAYSNGRKWLEKYNSLLTITKFGKTIDAPNKQLIIDTYGGKAEEVKKALKDLDEEAKKFGEKGAEHLANIWEGLEDTSPKGKAAITEALVKVGEAKNQYLEESKRVYRETENMRDRELQKAEEAARQAEERRKKAEEAAKLESRIATLKEQMKTATGEELTMMATRLVLLEQELKLRDAIIEAEISMAKNEELKSKGAQNIYEAIRDMAKAAGIDLNKKAETDPDKLFEANKLRKQLNDKIKAEKKEQKELTEEQQKQLDLQREHIRLIDESIGSIAGLINQYGEALGMTEEQQKVVNDGLKAMSGIAKIAAGDIVGGATQIVDSLLSSFLKTEEKIQERFLNLQENVEKMINSINVATEALGNIGGANIRVTLSTLYSELYKVQASASDLVKKIGTGYYGQQNYSALGYNSASSFYTQWQNQIAPLEESINKLSQRLMSAGGLSDDQREAVVAVLESYNSLMAEMDAITQELTGTTVNELGNSLAEAFLQGEDAAEAWGDKVNSIIKNVIIKQMTAELLQKPIQKAIDTLIADTNGGLSVDEANKFKTAIEQLSNSVQPAFEAAAKALGDIGIDLASGATASKGMTGDIQRVTEDTASALAGNISAIRLNMQRMIDQGGDSMSLLQKSLEYQQRTADNTEGMWKVLDKIESRFGRIETDGLKVK